nr:unnamed protein product [Ipomoea trifida]
MTGRRGKRKCYSPKLRRFSQRFTASAATTSTPQSEDYDVLTKIPPDNRILTTIITDFLGSGKATAARVPFDDHDPPWCILSTTEVAAAGLDGFPFSEQARTEQQQRRGYTPSAATSWSSSSGDLQTQCSRGLMAIFPPRRSRLVQGRRSGSAVSFDGVTCSVLRDVATADLGSGVAWRWLPYR